MDGRGRSLDNVFVERLWRSVKYEEVFLHDYATVEEAMERLKIIFRVLLPRMAALVVGLPDAAESVRRSHSRRYRNPMRRLICCLNRTGTHRETDPMDRKGTWSEIERC
jgi:hypothetical protein